METWPPKTSEEEVDDDDDDDDDEGDHADLTMEGARYLHSVLLLPSLAYGIGEAFFPTGCTTTWVRQPARGGLFGTYFLV